MTNGSAPGLTRPRSDLPAAVLAIHRPLAPEPLHDLVNAHGRIAVAVVGTLFVEPDTLSELCRKEKLPHEALVGEVIFRPVLKRTGKALAGYGLSGIATTHPTEILEKLEHTTHGDYERHVNAGQETASGRPAKSGRQAG